MHFKQIKTKKGQSRWEGVADGPANPATGKRNQITRRGKTQKEAKNKVNAEIERQNNHGINKKVTRKTTFEDVAQEWLASYDKTGKSKNTIRIRRQQMDVLNQKVAKIAIGEIDHFMYQRVIYDIEPGRERTTVQGINSCANMIFKYAIRNSLMKNNPSTDVVIPKKRKTIEEIKESNIEEKYLEHDEIDEFLMAVMKYGMKFDKERFVTLIFSGMRPGELCALQKQDLLFDKGAISITKTLYNERNNMKEYELTPPKTDGSVREVEMEEPIMAMLKSVVLENDKHKMQYRTLIKDFHDKDFIFARGNGYPFITKTLLNRMNRILTKTSIKKYATPHIFRHTHISMMAEAKVDISTIMKRVGHEDIETTMGIYTHVTDKMKKDASDKTMSLYGNILQKIVL